MLGTVHGLLVAQIYIAAYIALVQGLVDKAKGMRRAFSFALNDDTQLGDHQFIAGHIWTGTAIGKKCFRRRIIHIGHTAARCFGYDFSIWHDALVAIVEDTYGMGEKKKTEEEL